MVITNQQEAEQFIFSYLEQNPTLLPVIKQKFFSRRKKKLVLVDAATEQRIGEALAEHQAGLGIRIKTDEELGQFLDSIKHDLRDRVSA